jgi:hypothetical protein
VFEELRLACIVLFTASIPLLVVVRYKYRALPAWLLIVLATAVGLFLPYAHMSLRGPMIQHEDREHREAAQEYMRHPPSPIQNSSGEMTVENPYPLVDYLPAAYHPATSLLYGPAYLLGCWLAGWFFFRRSTFGQRRKILLVSIGLIAVEWTALISGLILINPPSEFFSDGFPDGWNSFFGPQLTLPPGMLVAWVMVVWLPAVIATIFRRRIRGA